MPDIMGNVPMMLGVVRGEYLLLAVLRGMGLLVLIL